jgi:hypothetical protein
VSKREELGTLFFPCRSFISTRVEIHSPHPAQALCAQVEHVGIHNSVRWQVRRSIDPGHLCLDLQDALVRQELEFLYLRCHWSAQAIANDDRGLRNCGFSFMPLPTSTFADPQAF